VVRKAIYLIVVLLCIIMLPACNGKEDKENNAELSDSSMREVYTFNNIMESEYYRPQLFKVDGTFQEFNSGYGAVAIPVSKNETYYVSANAVNQTFPLLICVDEQGKSYGGRNVISYSEDAYEGWFYDYEITIPDGANMLIINTTLDSSVYVKEMISADTLPVLDVDDSVKLNNNFAWSDFDKSYFIFVHDDTNYYTYSMYKLFHEYEIPLSSAVVIENLNDSPDGFDGKVKDILDLIVNDGGEVLVHYYGNLSDKGYINTENDGVVYSSKKSDWYDKVVKSKAILEDLGYNVRGIMRADYTQIGSNTGESYCQEYYDYSDGLGKSSQYNIKRNYMMNYSTVDDFKNWIDSACEEPGIYPICFHGWEDIATKENMSEIIEYIKNKDADTVAFSSYAEVFDKFGTFTRKK
jgi:hypothetical protein